MNYSINKNSVYAVKLNNEKDLKRHNMHSFHRYYGKLIPAIPSLFIKEFTQRGDVVFDPFTGSGTTAVEALVNNRNFIGTEINPLSCLISTVKTSDYKVDVLESINLELLKIIDKNKDTIILVEEDYPYVVNRDHWFKNYVQKDLLVIEKSIIEYFENNIELLYYRDFYYVTLSAIIRNVSNADTLHVFPGVSKRMRRLEEEGKININVYTTFDRAIKKRARYYDIYENTNTSSTIIEANISDFDIEKHRNSVDLIVTNPPYISSVRYIETMKLEMYWSKFLSSSDEYTKLSKKMLGNDRLNKSECQEIEYTQYNSINLIIEALYDIDAKSAKIVGEFFNKMEKTIISMNKLLKINKKAVIKISDSKIKGMKVETGLLMTEIAESNGFKLIDIFIDKINDNSRSLTTARNTYSDIITHDYIIIWEKINELQ